jgi:hypothetical protein
MEPDCSYATRKRPAPSEATSGWVAPVAPNSVWEKVPPPVEVARRTVQPLQTWYATAEFPRESVAAANWVTPETVESTGSSDDQLFSPESVWEAVSPYWCDMIAKPEQFEATLTRGGAEQFEPRTELP